MIAALYVGGLVHWALLFGTLAEPFRGPAFTREDWRKEYRYTSILQQAVRQGEVPYFISRPIHTRRFLALPETTWSPQIILLRVLDPGRFLLVNTCLLYTAGFVGLLALGRQLRLGSLPLVFLFLLFFLNGHVTAHLAVGHSMWAAHLLLPWLCLAVLVLADDPSHRRAPLAVALVLFIVLLQGGFHLFVWCVMLMGLLAVFDRRKLRAVARALAWTLALSVCRLAPAYFLIGRKDQTFVSGIPSFSLLWRGLVSLVPPNAEQVGGRFGELASWEYDHYIGLVGMAWLAFFGLWRAWRGPRRPSLGLLLPLLAMAMLSFGDLYAPWNALPLPLLSAERVSARFLLLPLLFLAVFSARRMQEWLDERPGGARRMLAAAGGLALAASLVSHSRLWRLESIESMLPERHGNLAIAIAAPPFPLTGWNHAYVTTVRVSALFSLAALVLLATRWRPRGRAAPRAERGKGEPRMDAGRASG